MNKAEMAAILEEFKMKSPITGNDLVKSSSTFFSNL